MSPDRMFTDFYSVFENSVKMNFRFTCFLFVLFKQLASNKPGHHTINNQNCSANPLDLNSLLVFFAELLIELNYFFIKNKFSF